MIEHADRDCYASSHLLPQGAFGAHAINHGTIRRGLTLVGIKRCQPPNLGNLRAYPDLVAGTVGELISRSLDMWAYFNGVKLDFSRPGKPTDNAVIESFNGRLRDECLNQHWFLSLDEARAVTEAFREDYNRVRPHGALGNRTPSEFARPVDGHAHLPALHG